MAPNSTVLADCCAVHTKNMLVFAPTLSHKAMVLLVRDMEQVCLTRLAFFRVAVDGGTMAAKAGHQSLTG